MTLSIGKGTVIRDVYGNPLTAITASPVTAPAAPPPQQSFIMVYTFGPEGSQFYPPIVLTMSLTQTGLPPNASATNLYIAWWDGMQWQALPSHIDYQNKTVSASVSHFSTYALLDAHAEPSSTPNAAPSPGITPRSPLAVTGADAKSSALEMWWLLLGGVLVVVLVVGIMMLTVRWPKHPNGVPRLP